MIMNWAGVTPEQYHQVRDIVDWESNTPDGAVLHTAAFDANGLRVTDIWESAEQFNTFAATRLMPAVAQAGVSGAPNVEMYPAERIFVPGFTKAPAKEMA